MAKVKGKLNDVIKLRCSEYEKNFIEGLAKIYAKGNVSLWMIYAAMNVERKFLDEDSLPESRRRKKGKKNG